MATPEGRIGTVEGILASLGERIARIEGVLEQTTVRLTSVEQSLQQKADKSEMRLLFVLTTGMFLAVFGLLGAVLARL